MPDQSAVSVWWPSSPAADLLRDVTTVVPVVGAGLSTAAGLVSPAELAQRLWAIAGAVPTTPAPGFFAAADAAYRSRRMGRAELNREVARWVSMEANPQAAPTVMHHALVRSRSRLIVTFNYDLLLEEAAERQGLRVRSLTHRDAAELTEHLRSRDRGQLCIYHAHGSCADPDTQVLDDGGYRAIANDLAALRALEFLAELNTLCFLGTRLDEPYLQGTLLRLPSVHPRHVLICDEQTAREVADDRGRGALLPTRYGIVTSAFPAGAWKSLESFCERLTAARGSPRRIALSAREDAPYAQYVEPPIRIRARDAYSEVMAYVKLALSDNEEISFPDVSRAWRAVVVGPAGCGKTSLLHRLGSSQPDVELPVMIDLASVSHFRGSPEELLAQWLHSGAAFNAVDISSDARAVLLLDGLDEIDLGRQEEAAGAVASLARAFPQHRFIVASRVVPAVGLLAAAGFVEFEIHPTRWFADEFLAACGTTVSALKRQLPEVAHLGSLGSNPYVMTELVRLAAHVPEDLDSTQRFRWLLDELVGAFTSREAGRLAYSKDLLRETVGALAAAMALHGLRTLDVTTYPFETDATVIVSHGPEDFLQDAARRLLVWAERSEFAFTEPVIKLFLAAEHVLRIDPEAKALHQAVAPRFVARPEIVLPDRRAVEVEIAGSGVRPDLEGLAALLAVMSPVWASKLFASAPALVARATAPDATTPAAEVRAKALWDAIVEPANGAPRRRLSSSVRQLSWLPSPKAALAAILRARRQPAMQERLRRITRRASAPAHVRGSALEILALGGRLSRRLLEQLAADPDIPVTAIATAVVETRHVALVERLVRLGTEASEWGADRVVDALVELMPSPETGLRIVTTLGTLDPDTNERYFWKLVGVVRVHGSDDDVAALWTVLVERHASALRGYLEAVPAVLRHMGLRLFAPRDGRLRFGETLGQRILALLDAVDLGSEEAVARRTRLREPASAAPTRSPKRPQESSSSDASESESAIVRSSPGDEAPQDGVPVLMVRDELSDIMRSLTYGLGGERKIGLIDWVPPDLEQEWNAIAGRGDEPNEANAASAQPPDPLMVLEEAVDRLSPQADWEDIEPIIIGCRRLSFAERTAIGARLEQRLPQLARDAQTPERAQLLSRYGSLLGLQPSPTEWTATAIRTRRLHTDWLKTAVPQLGEIRAIVGAASPADLPAILDAMPAEMRAQVVDDTAAVLRSMSPRSEATVLAVARTCADGAGDASAIARLRHLLEDPSPLLDGWMAAAGDASNIRAALAFVAAETLADRGADLADSLHLGWVESALGRASEADANAIMLIRASVHATLQAGAERNVVSVAELLQTTACMFDPVGVVALLEVGGRAVGWQALKEPLASFAADAKGVALCFAGINAAGDALGISHGQLRGQRTLLRFTAREL